MDLVVLPILIFLLGSFISIFSTPFRKYWLVAVAFSTVGALAFQLAVYVQLGFLDPFYQIAFVSSWLILFALATLGYLAYWAMNRRRSKVEQ